jgi:single-stranded-DNA-specific exonuclease
MRWQLPSSVDAAAVKQLSDALHLHPLCAQLLIRRGHHRLDEVNKFLQSSLADLPDPFHMKDMPLAAERLALAIQRKERIVLYGDYDVDGVTSTALMTGVLRELGAQSEFYIPLRLEEGYGLNTEAVKKLAEKGRGLLITLDCGINSVAEVQAATAAGLEVVVVDHHTPDTRPDALAILNPHQPGCAYPSKHLCAAGVAFNLLMATRKVLRDRGFFQGKAEPNLKAWLDLVAMATVADVVPLVGANRIFVKHGLTPLSQGTRPGVRALKEVADLAFDAPMTAMQVAFKMAPRINAAGRLGAAAHAVRLLTTPDVAEAERIARSLDVQNKERQNIERKMTSEALAMGEQQLAQGAMALVLPGEGWHAGVVGIVAARVVDRLHRPALVLAVNDGVGKGSGRSMEGFNLFDALKATSHVVKLDKYGGHKHAAGVTLQAERMNDFIRAFQSYASAHLRPDDLEPRLRVDAELPLSEVTLDLIQEIDTLGPFGAGNPMPVFYGAGLASDVRQLLAKNGDSEPHLKLSLRSSDVEKPVDAIGFGLGSLAALCKEPVQAAFQLEVNTYGGISKPQLKLKHLRPVG